MEGALQSKFDIPNLDHPREIEPAKGKVIGYLLWGRLILKISRNFESLRARLFNVAIEAWYNLIKIITIQSQF